MRNSDKRNDKGFFVYEDNNSIENQLSSIDIEIVENTGQTFILITEDKLKLCLQSHISIIKENKDWITPFSLLISLVLALISSDFKDYFFSKNTWNDIFVISAIVTFVWLIFSVKNAFERQSIDMLISKIKLYK